MRDEILFSGGDIPGSYELIDEDSLPMSISTREGIDSTASKMISQQLSIRTLEESDDGIDLRSDVRTVFIIFCLSEDALEASSSLFEIDDDIFSVVSHKRKYRRGKRKEIWLSYFSESTREIAHGFVSEGVRLI